MYILFIYMYKLEIKYLSIYNLYPSPYPIAVNGIVVIYLSNNYIVIKYNVAYDYSLNGVCIT